MEGSFKGSLLHLLDRTATGFGGRLLRRWVAQPLADRGRILQRLDAVEVRRSGRPQHTLRQPPVQCWRACAFAFAVPGI